MARKKCKLCLACYTVFWLEGTRYYYCWLCQKYYNGRDDNLQEVPNPREHLNVPVVIEEQE